MNRYLLAMLVCLVGQCGAFAADSDGDGLRDLMDIPGVNADASGKLSYAYREVEDLDGANLLVLAQTLELGGNRITSIESGDFQGLGNLRTLGLGGNQIRSIEIGDFQGLDKLQTLGLSFNQLTSIESDDFQGLGNLHELYLRSNQITSIESKAFQGLNNLNTLILDDNDVTQLNLSGAVFNSLRPCQLVFGRGNSGFCVDRDVITSLVLDDAVLSADSFAVIVNETTKIANASLVGVTFSENDDPTDMGSLLSISTLDNVRVDDRLFARYAAEFNAFATIPGKTVTVAGDFDGDRQLTVVDVDQLATAIRNLTPDTNLDLTGDGLINVVDQESWVHRLKGTYIGDANLDGLFNSTDLAEISQAGHYQDGIVGNSTWATGDWNADSEFDRLDIVLALQDGGYGMGPQAPISAIPEPGALFLLLVGLCGCLAFAWFDKQ